MKFFSSTWVILVLAGFGVAAGLVQQGGSANRVRQLVLQRLVSEAPIAFVGTVTNVGGASFSDVPKERATVVMRLDAVLEAPAAMSLSAGQVVTVGVRGLGLLEPGAQATVFARSWLFGDGIALEEISSQVNRAASSSASMASMRSEIQMAKAENEREAFRVGLQAADLVVEGRVRSIREVQTNQTRRPQPVTEHQPRWREAVVEVNQELKGPQQSGTVVIRFASSNDAAWRNAPKFQSGQAGTFCVHYDRVSGSSQTILDSADVQAFAATEASAFLTGERAELARELLKK